MTGLLRSELRKVAGTRTALGMLLGALAIIVVALGFTLWGPADGGGVRVEGASTTLATQGDVVSMLGVVNVVSVFALLFGVTFVTSEFRHDTAATTFLAEPRRWRVCAAKAVAAGTVAVGFALAALASAAGMLWLYVTIEGIALPLGGEVAAYAGLMTGAVVLNAVMGVGVGAAIRNQVGAIVAVLLWLFVAESLIGGFLGDLARWTPFAAGNAMLTTGAQLSTAVASAVATAYALAAVAVGTYLTEHRDAT
jgi:hypothetical protein